jgi:hypothetical protein
MFARFDAQPAAVRSACRRRLRFHVGTLAGIAAMTAALCGCMPATVPLSGADPADPSAKVARAEYRSTIAPYTSMRPSSPTGWGDGGTAPPRPDR